MVTAAFLLCAAGTGAVDIAALGAFDIDPALKQFIGLMYAEFQADKTALRAELADERRKNEARGQQLQEFANQTEARLDRCEAEIDSFSVELQRRRAQSTEAEGPEDVVGDAKPVMHFRRNVDSLAHLDGRPDESNGAHHRRLGEGQAYDVADCSDAAMTAQLERISSICCADEPTERCSNGRLHTCNARCAAEVNPLWTFCQAELRGQGGEQGGQTWYAMRDAAAICGAQPPELMAQTCPDGTDADSRADCIPQCTARKHGYLLLLTVDDADDAKLTCERHLGAFSWVGGAADGGYIGHDCHWFL
eukprot:SAG31_NODE_8261_length_1486_cov_2.990627_1_plen_305_part_01